MNCPIGEDFDIFLFLAILSHYFLFFSANKYDLSSQPFPLRTHARIQSCQSYKVLITGQFSKKGHQAFFTGLILIL